MTIKIRVDLIIKDKTIELSFEEAKEIYIQLQPLFYRDTYMQFPHGIRGQLYNTKEEIDKNIFGPGRGLKYD